MTDAAKPRERFDVSAAVAGLRVAEEQLRIAQRFHDRPVIEVTECPLCGLHPYDFTVEEYARELDRKEAQLAETERILRVISGWNTDRVSTADAIQPALGYFAAKEAHLADA